MTTSKKPSDKRKTVRPKRTARAFPTGDIFREGKRVGFEAGRQSRDEEITDLQTSFDVAKGAIERQAAELAAAQNTINERNSKIAAHEILLDEKNRDLHAKDARIAKLTSELEVVRDAYDTISQYAHTIECTLTEKTASHKREQDRLVAIIGYLEICLGIVRTDSIVDND